MMDKNKKTHKFIRVQCVEILHMREVIKHVIDVGCRIKNMDFFVVRSREEGERKNWWLSRLFDTFVNR